eukprot:scaffold34321_cov17-Prasinocladus_malaysianus.AAC.1
MTKSDIRYRSANVDGQLVGSLSVALNHCCSLIEWVEQMNDIRSSDINVVWRTVLKHNSSDRK